MDHADQSDLFSNPVLSGSHATPYHNGGLIPDISVSNQSEYIVDDIDERYTNCTAVNGKRDKPFGNQLHDRPRDSYSRDSDYKSISSPSPDARDDDDSCHNSRVPENGDAVRHRKDRVPSSGIESSTESYNERILRSGTWPLAEGSSRLHNAACSLHASVDNSLSSADGYETGGAKHKPDTDIEIDDKNEEEEETKDFNFRELTRDQIIVLVSTSFTNLLSFLSLSILAPFFPLEADYKDVNSTISGWIFGIFALVQFLASPVFGRLLPVMGSKFMYVSGMFLCGGCTLLFGVLDKIDTSESNLTFILLCFITRVLLALGCTGLSNSGFVILVRFFPDNVGTVFGIGEIFTGVGMVAGPALGGFLYSAGGFIMPFAVIGGCCFAMLPLVWYFLPPLDDTSEEDTSDLSIWSLFLHPRTIVNSIVIIVAATVWSVLDPTLEPHLRVYNLGPEMVGVLFLIMAAFYSLTSPLWGRISDKLPDNRTLLIPGLLICAVGLLLAGPSPLLGFQLTFNELWLSILSLVVLGIGSSMSIIPTYDIYVDVLGEVGYPEDTKSYGMVSGLWVSMYALGDFVGPTLGGFLFDEIGFEWLTTWIGALCALTSLIVIISWVLEKKFCARKRTVTPGGQSAGSNSVDVSEKTPLLMSQPEDDVLRTYPPGQYQSSV